jgi:gliding motility-associated-like protein
MTKSIKINQKTKDGVRSWLIVILLFCWANLTCYSQLECSDFTITGTSPSDYFLSEGTECTIAPIPAGDVLWTQTALNGVPDGFVQHTFDTGQTNVSIWYTFVNDDDFGTISINGGGTLTLSIASGCSGLSGDVVGPYTGEGGYGDVLVTVQSTLPFTEVTLVNTGGQSGHGSGDCNSVIFNDPLPCFVDLGNDTTLCQGETLTLDPATPGSTYLWQDSSTDPTFTVTESGTYWVDVTISGCLTTDTILVDFISIPIDLGNDTTLCQGETITLDATTPDATYMWQDGSTDSTLAVSNQGTYAVEVTVNGCTAADTILVSLTLLPVIDLGPDTTICQGDTLTLDATTTNGSYLWQDNSTLPTFSVTRAGVYVVQVSVDNCTSVAAVSIDEEDCEVILILPNVFTPNNDGLNDLFVPLESKGIVSMNTVIYNRWGTIIFETDNLMIEWSGEDFSEGTYFWIITYSDVNAEKGNLKGQVTLFK